MRCLDFVSRIVWPKAVGSVLPHTIVLADVLGNGHYCLVVGDTEGQLALFRDDVSKIPWRKAKGLGTISCICLGRIGHERDNDLVVVITAEGDAHLFDCREDDDEEMHPCYTFRVTRGVIDACMNDFGEGAQELLSGTIDGFVHAYSMRCSKDEGWHVALRRVYRVGNRVDSMRVHTANVMLVGHPGGGCTLLQSNGDTHKVRKAEDGLGQSTAVVGGLHHSHFAYVTQDGHLIRMNEDCKEVWSISMLCEMFAATRMTISENERIVVCGWDGTTIMMDEKRQGIKFHFGDSVCAFVGGGFSIHGKVEQSLAYVTLSGAVVLYKIPFLGE